MGYPTLKGKKQPEGTGDKKAKPSKVNPNQKGLET
jgi:hypothetical protein